MQSRFFNDMKPQEGQQTTTQTHNSITIEKKNTQNTTHEITIEEQQKRQIQL